MRRIRWFNLRKSFERKLLEAGADYDELDDVCDREVWRVIAEIRKKRVFSPYVLSAKLAWSWLQLKWRILREQHRIPAAQVHSGPDQTSGAGPGAAGFATSGYSTNPTVSVTTGSTGASTIVTLSPHEFEDAGIKAGEVTAYRCWKLHDDGLLHSIIYNNFVWNPGETAEGDPSEPGEGIYAYKSVLLLHQYGSIDDGAVTGTVDLWGEVYEHQHGYRAQYAAISSIHDSPYYDAKKLRKLYRLTRKRKKK